MTLRRTGAEDKKHRNARLSTGGRGGTAEEDDDGGRSRNGAVECGKKKERQKAWLETGGEGGGGKRGTG